MTNKYTLTVGWLYPELMSTYGDRGNILVLQQRCTWRGIQCNILPIQQSTEIKELAAIDLIFGGGAQDRAQEIVMKDLKGKKGDLLTKKIEENTPALFVCGAPQLMGNYYEPGEGQRIEGLGIFDMTSVHPGPDQPRLIGNIVGEIAWNNLTTASTSRNKLVVGFENHGGRTYLGKNAKPFATVLKGHGNNGVDKTEGAVYKNAIGCYFHGPLLPKNPHVADHLITTALEKKYEERIELQELDDTLEYQAQKAIAEKLGITI